MQSFVVIVAVFGFMALMSCVAPRSVAAEAVADNGKRLPFGVAGAMMWVIGILVAAGGYFCLYAANHIWASSDQGAVYVAYPTRVIWCFAPGFAALSLPYFATLWLLRRFDYAGQAAEIVAKGNAKMNANGERVMWWLFWGIVVPITLFTVPEIPAHLAVSTKGVSLTRYAHLKADFYPFADARRAWVTDGYSLRDGSFQSRPDLIIEFSDGRRLRAMAESDGGDPAPPALVFSTAPA